MIADLGLTPGHKSIVFGTSGRKLYVVLWDGTVAPGFPVTLPGDVFSSPAIGDLDNDGIPDIVVGFGSTIEGPSSVGGVRAFKRDGTVLWTRNSGDFNSDHIADPVMSTPAIGDIDGDGLVEVAWGSLDANIYVVRGADGVSKPGWPKFVRDTIFSSPALADLDGDGKLEVVIGVDAHLEGPPFNTPNGGCLHVLRFDATEVPGFPQCIDQVIISSPAIGDIDGDGKPEIVVGTGIYYSTGSHRLYAFRCDGSAEPGWPVPVDGQVITAPALADLDGDGKLDVIATDYTGSSAPDHVYAFKGNGTLLWKTQPKDFFGNTLNIGHPVVADILGDGNLEVIVPTNSELCVLSNTGAQLTDDGSHFSGSFSFFAPTAISSAAVADMENDGVAIEVVAISANPFPSATDTQVYVWTPKPPSTPPWGMYRQNPLRLGVAPGTSSCGTLALSFYTLTPCRVFDTRVANGPLGGPVMTSGASRDFPLTTSGCGIPASAVALSGNFTVTGGTNPGSLIGYAKGTSPPITAIIDWSAGQTRANNAIIRLGTSGSITVKPTLNPNGTVHVIFDVNGYFK